MEGALLELKNVEKSFPQGHDRIPVLRNVDLRIERGEFVSVMGPSGSGKSTLLNILSCLDTIDVGSYHFSGDRISNLKISEMARIRNRSFGCVFQSYNLLPRASALENVALPLRYRRLSRPEQREAAAEVLTALGLGARLHHRPNQLSGGEQQRVAIARAVVASPAVLFADEPTGALDSRAGRMIMRIFQALNEQGLTIVLVTHDQSVANYGSRTITLLDGRVIGEASVGSHGCVPQPA
jgi:putative ABC transport system ATP-binding protein